jgi:regulator of replication initiation timing
MISDLERLRLKTLAADIRDLNKALDSLRAENEGLREEAQRLRVDASARERLVKMLEAKNVELFAEAQRLRAAIEDHKLSHEICSEPRGKLHAMNDTVLWEALK